MQIPRYESENSRNARNSVLKFEKCFKNIAQRAIIDEQ